MNLPKAFIGTIAGLSLAYNVEAQHSSLFSIQKDTAMQAAINLNLRDNGDLIDSRPDPQEVLNSPYMLTEYTDRMNTLMNLASTDKETFMNNPGWKIVEKIEQYKIDSSLGRTKQEVKNDREFLQKAIYIEEEQLKLCNRYVDNVLAQRKRAKRADDMILKYPISPADNATPAQKAAYEQQKQQYKQETEQLAKELGALIAEADDIAQQIANVHPISREWLNVEKRKVFEQKSIPYNDNLRDAERLHHKTIAIFRMACKNELDVRKLSSLLLQVY